MTQNDLFGHTPAQGSLFGEGENRMASPKKDDEPDPAKVRVRLHDLLAKAKQAKTMPWNERQAGMWEVVFPQMANWLPEEEAEQLRFAFAQEMERLSKAA
ncbi:MAG: hypothetical protein KGO94_10600 [Alphaproteobacteria bacterium]|nr:hypothetical protein [Alphaproteobacteria bacterium]